MCKDDKGFTLIEFLVAIVILMVGMLGLLQSVNISLYHNLATQLRNEAILVADGEMSKQLSRPFELVSTASVATFEPRKILMGGFKNFSVFRTGASFSNSKELNVEVSWHYKGNRYTHQTASAISRVTK